MVNNAVQSLIFENAQCEQKPICADNRIGGIEFIDFEQTIADRFLQADSSQTLEDLTRGALQFWVDDLVYGWPQSNGYTVEGRKIVDDLFPNDELYLSAEVFISLFCDVGADSADSAVYSLVQFFCSARSGYLKYFVSAGDCQNQNGRVVSYLRDLRGLQKLILILELLKDRAQDQNSNFANRLENICSRLSGYLKMTLQGDFAQDSYWAEIEMQKGFDGEDKPQLYYTDIFPVQILDEASSSISFELSPEQKRDYVFDQAWIMPMDMIQNSMSQSYLKLVDKEMQTFKSFVYLESLPQIFSDELCQSEKRITAKRKAAKAVMWHLNEENNGSKGYCALYLHVLLGEKLGLIPAQKVQDLKQWIDNQFHGQFDYVVVEKWSLEVPLEEQAHVFAFAGKMAEGYAESVSFDRIQSQANRSTLYFSDGSPGVLFEWLRELIEAETSQSDQAAFATDHFDSKTRFIAEKVWTENRIQPPFPNAETTTNADVAKFLNDNIMLGRITREELEHLDPVFSMEFYLRRTLKIKIDNLLSEEGVSFDTTLSPMTCLLLDEFLKQSLPYVSGSSQKYIELLREILFEPYNKNDLLQSQTHSRFNPNGKIASTVASAMLDEIFSTQLFIVKMKIALPVTRLAAEKVLKDTHHIFAQELDDDEIVQICSNWTDQKLRHDLSVYLESDVLPILKTVYRYDNPMDYKAMLHRYQVIQSCLNEGGL